MGRVADFLTSACLECGGDDVDDDEAGEVDCEEMDCGRGAIAMAASPLARLYAGYPSHTRPDRTHLLH